MTLSYDVRTVKAAASGRWPEILAGLGGIAPESLDGRHHPCPKCGGRDRFRMIDKAAGAVYCNKCFPRGNGDGIAALRWLRGWGFREAVDKLRRYLGIKRTDDCRNTSGKGKKPKATKSDAGINDQVEWPATEQLLLGPLLEYWVRTKPPITPVAALAFGARFVRWPKTTARRFRCIAFAGRDGKGSNDPVAMLLYRVEGSAFPGGGSLGARKTHLIRGSRESWLWPGGFDDLRAADVIIKAEGPTDALALASLDLPRGWLVISNLCGCGSSNPVKLGFEFAAGKKVVVVGDCDEPGQAGAKRFAAQFLAAGAREVRIAQLPFETTPDHGPDLRDWIGQGRTVADFLALVEQAPVVTPEDVAAWAEKPKALPVTVKLVADRICEKEHFAKDASGQLYQYAEGVYKARGDQAIRQQVKRIVCGELSKPGRWSTRFANEVVEFIRIDAPLLWERPPRDIVNLLNGLLRISDRTLLPHSPGHLSSIQLPVNYDPAATCREIEKFVQQIFPADATDLAWELGGWLVGSITWIQKAVLLVGEGANGKSTWLRLLTAFLGRGNVSAVSLHKLESDRFAAARLIGKIANICPDLPSEHLAGTSIFKAIVGGDTLSAERKYADSFDFEPFCRLIFSANHLPRSPDASPAFFRRWLVLPFDRVIPPEEREPTETLDEKLHDPRELSGLLNRFLEALPRLRQRRGFSEPNSAKCAWAEFYSETDPLAIWLDRSTINDPSAYVPKTVLRTAYNGHCERAGRPTITEKAFTRALARLRPEVVRAQRTVGGRVQWCYIGIGLAGEDRFTTSQHSQVFPFLFSAHGNRGEEESEEGVMTKWRKNNNMEKSCESCEIRELANGASGDFEEGFL